MKTLLEHCLKLSVLLVLVASGTYAYAAGEYKCRSDVDVFIKEMTAKHGFPAAELEALFAQAEKKQSIIDAISRPAEKALQWKDYRKIFMTEKRIQEGVEFWQAHRTELEQVAAKYSVDPEFIIAIIGVETSYGKNKGSYRVLDALSTLAFDYPRRATFFRGQLEEFLLLAREQKLDPLELTGSYAGAMGYGQFIPSSYRSFAVDFSGDNVADIWNNKPDALASVANYFHEHGWKLHEPVVTRCRLSDNFNPEYVSDELGLDNNVSTYRTQGYSPLIQIADDQEAVVFRLEGEYGDEFWMGLHNFYVITRYNHSNMYALAVYQLAQAIRERVGQNGVTTQNGGNV